MKIKNSVYTPGDVLSEAILIADDILQRPIPREKKISKLWFLFNRGGWKLYNVLNQFRGESYTLDNIREDDRWACDIEDDVLEYVLVSNNIITPLEDKLLKYLSEWRGKYEIARLLKTTYYNVKLAVDTLTLKIERFLSKIDEEI